MSAGSHPELVEGERKTIIIFCIGQLHNASTGLSMTAFPHIRHPEPVEGLSKESAGQSLKILQL